MEYVLSKLSFNDSISIVGDTNQVLQIILKRNSACIINKQFVSYASSSELQETPYHDLNKIITLKQKAKTSELIHIKNTKDTFEYIGLTNSGRIIKILPFLYNNLSVRLSSILLFSDTIDLVEDEDIKRSFRNLPRILFNNRLLFTQPSFYLIQSNTPLSTSEELNPLDYRLLSDHLYLSSDKPVIEKRLGDGETIIIKLAGLMAFEKSVKLSMLTMDNKTNGIKTYLNVKEDIVATGPGLIIFEAANSIVNVKPRYNIAILIIGISIIFIIDLILSHLLDWNNL